MGSVSEFVWKKKILFSLILQDAHILAWKFNVAGNCFEPAASLNGHRLAVVSLVVGVMRLYSGSMDHTIKVRTLVQRLTCFMYHSKQTDGKLSLMNPVK